MSNPFEENIASFNPSITNQPSNHAQALIDQEISQMAESIRALKTRRNEMSPVSKLPPELLCKIFELVQHSGARGAMFQRLSDLFRWTKITHVSRRWMHIALSDTSLWSNITITGRWPEWEEEVLNRSRHSPISLSVPAGTIQLDYVGKLDVFKKALAQLHRVTTLTIEGLYPFDLERVLSGRNIPPPILLRSLKLSTSFTEWNGSPPANSCTVFEEIFPSAIGLTSLSLTGYGVQWNPIFFSNLRRLKITNTIAPFRPSIPQVLSALSGAQSLESLMLSNSLQDSPWNDPQHQVIHLPRLHKLHIIEMAVAASRLLRFLTFPNDVTICVECNTADLSQPEFHALLHIFDRSVTREIRVLTLMDSTLSQDIHVWEVPNGESFVGTSHNHSAMPPDMSLILDHLMSFEELDQPILQACRILPLRHLETLNLDVNITIPHDDWVNVFGSLRHLKWITLGTNAAIPLFYAILSSSQIILPAFRCLCIKLNAFRDPSPISTMQQALQKRQEQGISMTNLYLCDSSHLKPEVILALEQIVAFVKQSKWGQHLDLDSQNIS